MPKKSDQLAGGFDTENTGGLLNGLLAEEDNFDRRAMLRLGTWGIASVGAVIIAILANQTAIKGRRDDVAALDLTRQSMQISAVAKESQNEARRLASAIDTLNSDRDRMYTRLASVEQGLESVTGTIAKQKAAALPPFGTPVPTPPAASQSTPAQPSVANASAEPAPAVGPVATTAALLAAEKAHAEARKPAVSPTTMTAAPPAPLPSSPPSPPPVTTSAMPVVPRALMGPPDPAAPKMIASEPPAKPVATMPVPAASPTPTPSSTAAAAPTAPAATPAPVPSTAPATAPAPAPEKTASVEKSAPVAPPAASAPIEVKRTEFGVDVGGANSVAGLRALWRGLLKYRSNAPLAGLQPIIVVKEANNGLGMQLRLVAGPFSDAAAAARTCATIAARERSCETTVYDGQRLAIRAEDMPASTESISGKPAPEKPGVEKPSSERTPERESTEPVPEKPAVKPGSNRYFHRRGSYVPAKRTAAVLPPPPPVVEEPAKPESGSTLSGFFNRVHPQPQAQ